MEFHRFVEAYKLNIVVVKHIDDMRKVEEAPLGSLIFDSFNHTGYIKRNDESFNKDMDRVFDEIKNR